MQESDWINILKISTVTLLTVFCGSFFFFVFESETNQFVDTFFDAVWWSVVTLTSLGYGDIYPVTTEGRVVGMFLMFFGIILIGVIAGSVTRHYFEVRSQKRERKKL